MKFSITMVQLSKADRTSNDEGTRPEQPYMSTNNNKVHAMFHRVAI